MLESIRPSALFPERLRAAREHRSLDQAELGKRSGLQSTAISHFETGQRKPSFDNLRRLADALDVTTDYLIGRVSDFKGHAGTDRLHRHYNLLTAEDQDVAEKFLEVLAKRAQTKREKQ